jgi:Secretion system C-terminal sorting domain
LERRRIEDMILTTRSFRSETEKDERINIPLEYNLSQNYPNPFNPATTISFSLPRSENVRIIIYDITGKEVKELVNEFWPAGNYEINFNANGLSSGVYFYKIQSGEFAQTKRMVLIK